ncbi:MAG: DegT/DnrJ/EryC1/StrS family aminotransferase [Actinomycetota bacterium]
MESIPFIDIRESFRSVRSEIDAAVARVLDSSSFILGEELHAFERELADSVGFTHAIGVANGTDALHLSLRALDVGPGDRVAIPALTFFATAEAVIHAGATPVIVDVEEATSTLSPTKFTEIAAECKAVIPVHLYGHPAHMTPILETARKHNMVVIEDAAQAIGARYQGAAVGTFGDAAGISFYPTKNLGAAGDAGAVVTQREEIAQRIRSLRHHGQREERDVHHEIGFNSRLDDLQAAILRARLKHVDEYTKARRQIASWYREALHDLPLELPQEQEWAEAVYHLYVIRVDDRDRVAATLKENGIGTAVHYRIPLNKQPALKHLEHHATPVADAIAARQLALPMYPELTAQQVDRVALVLRTALA